MAQSLSSRAPVADSVYTSLIGSLQKAPGLNAGLYLLALGIVIAPGDPVISRLFRTFADAGSLTDAAAFLTTTGDILSNLVLLALILLVYGLRKVRLGVASVLSAAAACLLCEIIKMLVGRGRPELAAASAFCPFSCESLWHSFPSGHATNVAVVALFTYIAFPRLRNLVIPWAIAVSLSRCILARHYLGDVVAGWGVGIAVSAVVLSKMQIRDDDTQIALNTYIPWIGVGSISLAGAVVGLVLA